MNNIDILQRFLIENASIRGELVHLDQSFQTIVHQHKYPPFIQKLLGEALILVALLASIIKFKGRLTLQFQGKGKLKLLLAQCNHEFHLRGLVQMTGELQEADLLNDLKQGILVIMIDPDDSGKRYQGIVAWQGESLTESIEGYFRDSEQLRTRIWLAINETRAAGLLLQVMPRQGGAQESHSELVTSDADWEHVIHLTETITPEELLNLPSETILHRLYVQEDVRLFPAEPVMFQCTCSAKRGENAILLLGREEIEEELTEKQVIVVTCDFCNKEFTFDRVDIENIFRKGGNPPSSQVH
jgi:molecular chaperone Hsp33